MLEHDVDAGRHHQRNGVVVAVQDAKTDAVGQGALEPGEHRAKEQHRHLLRAADGEHALPGTKHLAGRMQALQRRLDGGMVVLAALGQHHASIPAVEQRRLERRLQLADVAADGRLGGVELLGGASHAAKPGGGLERDQHADGGNVESCAVHGSGNGDGCSRPPYGMSPLASSPPSQEPRRRNIPSGYKAIPVKHT